MNGFTRLSPMTISSPLNDLVVTEARRPLEGQMSPVQGDKLPRLQNPLPSHSACWVLGSDKMCFMSLLLELNCFNEFSSRLSSYCAKTDITVHASKIIVTGMTDDTDIIGCRHLTYSDPVITSAGHYLNWITGRRLITGWNSNRIVGGY